MKADLFCTNKLEMAFDYLRCLVLACDLFKKGVEEIEHKLPVSFYTGLLCLLDGSRPVPAIDDNVDDASLLTLVVPPLLAITDQGQEGEPDDSEPEDVDIDVAAHRAVSGSFQRWRPFTLRDFATRRNKQTRKQLLMRCPFHHDEGDPAGTFCYRSAAWTTQGEKKIVTQRLREWTLRGRFVRHRSKPDAREDSHKFIGFSEGDMRSLQEQDALLQQAMLLQRWSALPSAECASDKSDSERSSSSS